jgi:hypothetical protein
MAGDGITIGGQAVSYSNNSARTGVSEKSHTLFNDNKPLKEVAMAKKKGKKKDKKKGKKKGKK